MFIQLQLMVQSTAYFFRPEAEGEALLGVKSNLRNINCEAAPVCEEGIDTATVILRFRQLLNSDLDRN